MGDLQNSADFEQGGMQLSAALSMRLRSPIAPHEPLVRDGDRLVALSGGVRSFPIKDGVPILIDEASSVFSIADFENARPTTMDLRDDSIRRPSIYSRLRAALVEGPLSLTRDVSDFNSRDALALIAAERPGSSVLIIGAGEVSRDTAASYDMVYSDVALGGLTMLIADAHDIPFLDATFDAVIAEAVLEHVVDPQRCIAEIERVLKPDGWVFAVTPFMQQVHMGAYDFTRFTALGHRRLFRGFDSVRQGIAVGPGSALAWALEYWLTSFSEKAAARRILGLIARLVAIPFKYSDSYLVRKRGSIDGAGGFYFFGKRRDAPLHDREILRGYGGLGSPRFDG